MAVLSKKLPVNVPGEFYVDSTCIDCDTCRQLAPEVFGETGEYSFVRSQPEGDAQVRDALRALLCCPTGSIGTLHPNHARDVRRDFPLRLDNEVYYCGFNSPKSFGGNSSFVRHPAGNWLIDSPKYLPRLVRRFHELGGVANIFLTHRDDVADAAAYAREFGSKRSIHRRELQSQPAAEFVLEGAEPVELAPGFLAIPTPGHTAGHCVLLFENRFLFTGDHLDWDRDSKRLSASSDYCWYSWPQQIESMRKLAAFSFEWVLPGHGQRVQLPFEEMKRQMAQLVGRMDANDV
jgi:glyoxylase-like metal-dependent hydrolase (beta-lactamase superfamily II)/ferredoxin